VNWIKKASQIPLSEIHAVALELQSAIDYSAKAELIERYRGYGLQVVEDPGSLYIVSLVQKALREGRPYSVVRIGDGEANLLTFGGNIYTPYLNRLVAGHCVSRQADRFVVSDNSLYLVKHLMLESIYIADVVGVRGIYYMGMPDYVSQVTPLAWAMKLNQRPRRVGVLRSEAEMLKMARLGYLQGKVIASANLYLAIINNLELLLDKAYGSVILVTDQFNSVRLLQAKFPDVQFRVIPLPLTRLKWLRSPRMPVFVGLFEKFLGHHLEGSLVLVGAGPWAEFYCSIAKQRGAVAVDIGSGFDLLSGRNTRPFHRRLKITSQGQFSYESPLGS